MGMENALRERIQTFFFSTRNLPSCSTAKKVSPVGEASDKSRVVYDSGEGAKDIVHRWEREHPGTAENVKRNFGKRRSVSGSGSSRHMADVVVLDIATRKSMGYSGPTPYGDRPRTTGTGSRRSSVASSVTSPTPMSPEPVQMRNKVDMVDIEPKKRTSDVFRMSTITESKTDYAELLGIRRSGGVRGQSLRRKKSEKKEKEPEEEEELRPQPPTPAPRRQESQRAEEEADGRKSSSSSSNSSSSSSSSGESDHEHEEAEEHHEEEHEEEEEHHEEVEEEREERKSESEHEDEEDGDAGHEEEEEEHHNESEEEEEGKEEDEENEGGDNKSSSSSDSDREEAEEEEDLK